MLCQVCRNCPPGANDDSGETRDSGKSAFILQLAQTGMENGLEIAIPVNEIGKIGIANQYIRRKSDA
ncbi:MAG: hypothetical protein P8X68_10190 [Desulfobacterales bacterium]